MNKIARALMLLGIIGAGCAFAEERPNILLIVSEDNGPDLGCYGNTEVHTPHLDRMAQEGIKFSNAYVTYSVCSPSRGTIFTGLYPHQNGQIGLATHKYRMYDGIKTLPKYLGELGYRTANLGKLHVNPESAIPFDYRGMKGSNFAKKNMRGYAEHAEKFITASDKPFYLQVNFPDAHFPVQRQVEGLPSITIDKEDIDGPLPFVGADSDYLRKYTANYYNCMNRLDEAVGMLLESLKATGKADNTIIIYLSDHGAQFSRGKCSNYEAALKVPFIVKWPGKVKQGEVREEFISAIDLLPTFIDLAGGAIPEDLPGKSLLPLLDKPQREWRKYIFAGGAGCTSRMHYPRRSVRNERFKLVLNLNHGVENPKFGFYARRSGHFKAGTIPEEIERSAPEIRQAYATWKNPGEYELYDLQEDPHEFCNLAADERYTAVLNTLKSALRQWQADTRDPFADPGKFVRFNREIEGVKKKYSGHDYNKDSDFDWMYPEYFTQ
jgi:N-sulfoglucosamine sulfohydrolase